MATFNGSHGKGFILTLNNIKICQEPAWIFACSLIFFIYEEYYDHVIIVNLSLLLSYEKRIG